MVLVFFSHRNQEWDRVVTIYKIPVNFWLSQKISVVPVLKARKW